MQGKVKASKRVSSRVNSAIVVWALLLVSALGMLALAGCSTNSSGNSGGTTDGAGGAAASTTGTASNSTTTEGTEGSTAGSSTATAETTGADTQEATGQEVTVTVDVSAAVAADNSTAKNIAAEKGGASFVLKVPVESESTVLAVTKASGLDVTTNSASIGEYVTAINGLASGAVSAEAGWIFNINGEMAMDGADVAKVKAGDRIDWQYVTSFQ
ncbi:MAG: DUF4430 domain-containing protein [Actinomycetia bacterium]|nr:DUF4430 domain-containing protein [Actinomycetes bacterium]